MNSFRPGYNCKNYRQTNFAPCVARIECLLETAHVGRQVWFNQFQHYTSQPREKPNSTKSKTLPFSGLRCTFDSVRRRPTPARLCSDASSHRTRQNKKNLSLNQLQVPMPLTPEASRDGFPGVQLLHLRLTSRLGTCGKQGLHCTTTQRRCYVPPSATSSAASAKLSSPETCPSKTPLCLYHPRAMSRLSCQDNGSPSTCPDSPRIGFVCRTT